MTMLLLFISVFCLILCCICNTTALIKIDKRLSQLEDEIRGVSHDKDIKPSEV